MRTTGTLPIESLPVSLETLDLQAFSPAGFADRFGIRVASSHKFTRSDPAVASALTRLTNLKVLKMAQCTLTGDVPNSVAEIVLQLKSYDLRGNDIVAHEQSSTACWLLSNFPSSEQASSTQIIDASNRGLSGAASFTTTSRRLELRRFSQYRILPTRRSAEGLGRFQEFEGPRRARQRIAR